MSVPKKIVDVSLWQENFDYDKLLSQDVAGVIAKATTGNYKTDPCFVRNYEEAKKHGLLFGAYHWVRYDILPSLQLTYMQHNIKVPLDFIALDCEDEAGTGDKGKVTSYTLTLLNGAENFNGAGVPFVYTNPKFWLNKVNRSDKFAKYRLWIAQYPLMKDKTGNIVQVGWDRAITMKPTSLPEWGANGWTIWQYGQENGYAYGVNPIDNKLIDVDIWNPAVPFPGDEVAQPPEAMPEPETWTVTIKGIEYNLVKKGD